ncbi:MAG: DUF2892 domain-containing protein [Candidatus Moraniibacteriota bacterium]
MMKNEGIADRIARVGAAVVLGLLGAFVFSGVLAVVAYVVAAILLVTGSVGYCPAYKSLGIDTTKK